MYVTLVPHFRGFAARCSRIVYFLNGLTEKEKKSLISRSRSTPAVERILTQSNHNFWSFVLVLPQLFLPNLVFSYDQAEISPCHTAAILSRETKKALFYHAKPRSRNHGGEAWRCKTKLFWSPGTIWPPCDKGKYSRKYELAYIK